jgi:hypothetical protein
MGLQKVTRFLRLAESPELFQKAVAPGVLVEIAEQDGIVRNQHVKLEVSLVLAVLPYLRHQENVLGRPVALARTERLLQRIAKGGWPRSRVKAELAGTRKSTSQDDPRRLTLRKSRWRRATGSSSSATTVRHLSAQCRDGFLRRTRSPPRSLEEADR